MNTIEMDLKNIESKIYVIRGQKVMLDEDLAELYQVTTKRLNQQVHRNLKRFPHDFIFSLTDQEVNNLRLQIATANDLSKMRRNTPIAFTEQGIAMLSAVLHSDRAIEVNIAIMRAFVQLRQIVSSDSTFEKRLLELEDKFDGKFKIVFNAIKSLMDQTPIPRKKVKSLSEK